MATINGSAGNDILVASGDPSDTFNAGAGDDTITAGRGNDTINAGQGNDTVTGGDGNDLINGGDGMDDITGGLGNDTIFGGFGNDTFHQNILTDGADKTKSQRGDDIANITSGGVIVQVRLTLTTAEVGDFNAFDSGDRVGHDGGLAVRLQAEDEAGQLTGLVSRYDDEALAIVGGAGVTFDVRDLPTGTQQGVGFRVVSLGSVEADTMNPLAAGQRHYFHGGQGDDLIAGGSAGDLLVGGGGNDTLGGNGGADTLLGGDGADVLRAAFGNDTLDGGAGVDQASYVAANAGVTVSLLNTGPQNTGGAGTDTLLNIENLYGSRFADSLRGDVGANELIGGAGADRLRGGDGADVLTGGSGADTFVFALITDSNGAQLDRITDLSSVDIIDVSGIDANRLVAGNQAFTTRVGAGDPFLAPGQYRLVQDRGDTRLELNVDGDIDPDTVIVLAGDFTSPTADDGWMF